MHDLQGRRNRGGGGHGARPPPSLPQTVANKLLSLTTSLSVESQNTQLLHTLLERRPGQHSHSATEYADRTYIRCALFIDG